MDALPVASFGPFRTFFSDPSACMRCPWATSAGWPPPLMSPAAGLRPTAPPLLRCGGHPTAAARNRVCAAWWNAKHGGCKGGLGLAAARTRGAEKRRARGLARSAIRKLTHRGCLSAESEANEASSAMGPRDRASQGSRRAAPTAEHKRRSQGKHAFAWGPSQQAKNIERTDERTNFRNGPNAATEPIAHAAN